MPNHNLKKQKSQTIIVLQKEEMDDGKSKPISPILRFQTKRITGK